MVVGVCDRAKISFTMLYCLKMSLTRSSMIVGGNLFAISGDFCWIEGLFNATE